MTRQSDIIGNGHGSAHSWQNRGTPFRGATHYTCRVCGTLFTHRYNTTPNVFAAMRMDNVPAQCAPAAAEQWDST